MAADTSTSPLLRLPDELLMTIFDLVLHLHHEREKLRRRERAMPPSGYLVISKRLNRILTPQWYRKLALPYMQGDHVYSLLLSRPAFHPRIHDFEVSFPLEMVHTWIWTLSHFTALKRLVIHVVDGREEDVVRQDDGMFTLDRVGESLAALFEKMPHLVDFSINVHAESGIDVPNLDLGPCLTTGRIRRVRAPGMAFALPHLRDVKVQHLALSGEIAGVTLPFSELETLSLTTSDVDLADLTPFLDQYTTYVRQTGSYPRLRLLKVYDVHANSDHCSHQFPVPELVTFLNRISSTPISDLDLTLCFELGGLRRSVRDITPLRNVKTLRLQVPLSAHETFATVRIAPLIQSFPSLNRLTLKLDVIRYDNGSELDGSSPSNYIAGESSAALPSVPDLVRELSDTTGILEVVLEQPQGLVVWRRDKPGGEFESWQIRDCESEDGSGEESEYDDEATD